MSWKPLAVTLGVAAVLGALALGPGERTAATVADFDPVLSDGAQCVPQGACQRALLAELRKAAAATEVQPFAVPAGAADAQDAADPPRWEGLGAALLAAGDLDGAEKAFRDSLARAPNNGWALHGLHEVYGARGDTQEAARIERRFAQAWAGARGGPALERL